MLVVPLALLALSATVYAFRREAIGTPPRAPRISATARAEHYERYAYVEQAWGR